MKMTNAITAIFIQSLIEHQISYMTVVLPLLKQEEKHTNKAGVHVTDRNGVA